jgi:hypothetical protein
MKYFNPIPETLEELKKIYKKLSLKWHPDVGGSNEAMKIINAEYTELFEELKEIRTNANGAKYHKATTETSQQFIEIIDRLIRFEGIIIEIIGCFIWLSADTKPYKEELKAMGFKWSANKKSWYLAPEDYRRRSRKYYSLEQIRVMYGTQEVETEPFKKVPGQT